MGLRDQSWCSSCGQGIMYTEDENATCGECAQDSPNKLINLIEYMKIHLISLEQDSEELQSYFNSVEDFETDEYREKEIEDISNNGQIMATRHLMSVASDILNGDIQGKGY